MTNIPCMLINPNIYIIMMLMIVMFVYFMFLMKPKFYYCNMIKYDMILLW